ncbi:MAG: MmgE/PrpD family protein, partial [Gammaproteobacteria bacterium]
MAVTDIRDTKRPDPDELFNYLSEYVIDFKAESALARQTARYCLMDTLGCGLLALEYPACRQLLGPVVPGATLDNGARVPGT